MQSAVATREHV